MYSTDDAAGSVEYGPVLMVQGRYQVVALKVAAPSPPDSPIGYAVLNSAGGLVRRELSLEAAQRWATDLAEKELAERGLTDTGQPDYVPPAPPSTQRKRRR